MVLQKQHYKLPFTNSNISSVVPNKPSAIQEFPPEEVAVFASQPKIMDASTEKCPDVTPGTIFESHTIRSNKSVMRSNPAYGEYSIQEVSDGTCHVRCGPVR